MLYTASRMNRPNIPDELAPGTKDYSFRKDLEVNAWGYLTVVLSFVGDMLLSRHHDWPVALRAVIAVSPIIPTLLWGQMFARWIRGMDELHRRITVEVCLFATTATLFLFAASHPLVSAGIFQPLKLDLH